MAIQAYERCRSVLADLLDAESLSVAVRDVHPTHIFFNAWLRQTTEAENIAVNGAMLRNLLGVLDKPDWSRERQCSKPAIDNVCRGADLDLQEDVGPWRRKATLGSQANSG